MDSANRNKETYLSAKAAFNARDLDACVACYASDHKLMSLERPDGGPSIRRFFEDTMAAWPDIQIRVEQCVAEQNRVMGRSIAAATHPSSQTKVETTFWDLHLFNAEGLIAQTWNLMDTYSVMQQLASTPAPAAATGARTIASYETYAATYASLVNPTPSDFDAAAIRRLASVGGRVLEVGSGPGTDADYLESLGVEVDRTDATRAFLELQAARGKIGRLLNVLTDDLGGPYDGVMALCVLIHVGKDRIDYVLHKIQSAIRPGGALLVSMRDGDGETYGDYHMVYWRRDDFAKRLEAAGFTVEWDAFNTDRSGEDWNTFVARKPG